MCLWASEVASGSRRLAKRRDKREIGKVGEAVSNLQIARAHFKVFQTTTTTKEPNQCCIPHSQTCHVSTAQQVKWVNPCLGVEIDFYGLPKLKHGGGIQILYYTTILPK